MGFDGFCVSLTKTGDECVCLTFMVYASCVSFFSFLSFALLESKRISLLKNAGDDAPLYLWYSLMSLCFAGVWHRQLSGARATSTSCRKKNGRSRRWRRGGGWGGRSSWEQSHDLPVSPLTQTAIQRGEATTHISSVSCCLTVSLAGIIYQLGCKPCAVYNVDYTCILLRSSVLRLLNAALINIFL